MQRWNTPIDSTSSSVAAGHWPSALHPPATFLLLPQTAGSEGGRNLIGVFMRLYLCEKPSQGKDIAAVLGAKTRGNGCITGPGVVVTWGIGHLLETAAPDAYGDHLKNWSLDTLPILPAQWKVIVKPKTASQFKVVKQLLNEATELVIATDADREGEMIARELIEYCGYRGPIQRLWLSALNEASIRQALSSVKQGAETYPLYQSALARSRADWLIGM
ncbi:DNA topoisomerase, partial [Pseudomonas coronafaciens pv. porri]